MIIMRILDKILENLKDDNWHSFDDVKSGIQLPSDITSNLLSFLQEQAFITIKNGKLRITCLGLKFLYL